MIQKKELAAKICGRFDYNKEDLDACMVQENKIFNRTSKEVQIHVTSGVTPKTNRALCEIKGKKCNIGYFLKITETEYDQSNASKRKMITYCQEKILVKCSHGSFAQGPD